MSLTIKILMLALAILLSVIVALVTGLLAKSTGTPLADVMLRCGAAFGATMALGIAFLSALHIL